MTVRWTVRAVGKARPQARIPVFRFPVDKRSEIVYNNTVRTIGKEFKMSEIFISLKTIEDIRNFVNIVVLLNYEVDLIQGRYVVDAKSIMGIFSLDLLSPVKVEAHTNDSEALKKALAPFIVK